MEQEQLMLLKAYHLRLIGGHWVQLRPLKIKACVVRVGRLQQQPPLKAKILEKLGN